MGWKIPTRAGVIASLQNYVRGHLPELDTTTRRRGLVPGLVTSIGSLAHDWHVALKDFADHEPWPQTARDKFLTDGWWVPLTGLTRHEATPARGHVVLTGTPGAVLPAGSELVFAGRSFWSESSGLIARQTLNIQSLTVLDGRVVLETGEPHQLASGMSIEVTGASPAEYNGIFEITVTAQNELTFLPPVLPGGPSSATGQLVVVFASVPVVSGQTGTDQNVDAGSILQLSGQFAGVDDLARVSFGRLAGGADEESLDDFRERILFALSMTLGSATDAEIYALVMDVPGVTRVWIRKARLNPPSGWPGEGQVRVAFMRDSDANPFPSGADIEAVKKVLLEDDATKILPAHMVTENFMVFAPVRWPVDFRFTQIVPDNAGMRAAIRAALQQFFTEGVFFGADYPKEPVQSLSFRRISCVISGAVNPETGEKLQDFTLASPTIDLEPAPGELPVLGEVIFDAVP